MAENLDAIPSRLEAAAAYVLTGEHVCHECGSIVSVTGLMLAGPFTAWGDVFLDTKADSSALVRTVSQLPKGLASSLTLLSKGHFRPDFSHTVGETYWMNHCTECNAKIGDWFVHRLGSAFFPTNDAEIRKVAGVRLSGPWVFDDPNLCLSSWTDTWLSIQNTV